MPLKAGEVLRNRYRIQRIIGQGGMGSIYLADDLRLGRMCALKEVEHDRSLSAELSQQARDQFLREATVLARLDHPNLPKVSDYFAIGGRDYLVMDYVPGKDLRNLMTEARQNGLILPEKDILQWADGGQHNSFFSITTHTQQPDRGNRHHQPQTGRPVWLGHPGSMPLAAGSFDKFEALFSPSPQAIPAGLTLFNRQVGDEQPGFIITGFPAAQQGTVERIGLVQRARPLPTDPRPSDKAGQGFESGLTLRPKRPTLSDTQQRMPLQATDAAKQPGPGDAPVGRYDNAHLGWNHSVQQTQQPQPFLFPGVGLIGWQMPCQPKNGRILDKLDRLEHHPDRDELRRIADDRRDERHREVDPEVGADVGEDH